MSTNLAVKSSNVVPFVSGSKKAPSFPPWCKRTTTGLTIDKSHLSFDEWQKAFEAADANGKGHQWWIGDALNEGEKRFPDKWSQVLDPTEEERRADEGQAKTYREYQQVACRFVPARRRANLRFGHHHAVTYAMSDEEQDYWLDRADAEHLSVDKLRRKIRKARTGDAEGEPALDIQVLQDPAIRQWLHSYQALITDHDGTLPEVEGAKFLHRMCLAHSEEAERQLERTLAIDCGVVKRAVGLSLSATSDEIQRAMRVRGFFMSRADLEDRLKLLTDLGEIRKVKAEEQRVANARGDVVYEYQIVRKPGQPDTDDEEEDKRW